MYISSGGLGDFPRGQCPPLSIADFLLLRKAFEDRRDYSTKKRIDTVTDAMFLRRHPERWDTKELKIIKLPPLRSAGTADQNLIQEWGHLRDCLVIPAHRVWSKP